jgi:hypothetical protein
MAIRITPSVQSKLNDETNLRFWASTNYKPNQKLDAKDPYDAPMIPVWNKIASDLKAQFLAGTIKWGAPLEQETDARFWAQTGIKPGTKLDPRKPADKAMIPVWNDIHAKVIAQYLNDTIQWTYDHPTVTTNLAAAADATHVAADALAAATQSKAAATEHTHAAATAAAAGDTATAAQHQAEADQHHAAASQHIADAANAHAVSYDATNAAASVQPATASPPLVHRASNQVQDFVMNGAGRGVAIDEPHDMVGVMQTAAAPAKVDGHAYNAPASQTAPAPGAGGDEIPTFPPSSPDHEGKNGGAHPDRGRLALGLGIGASVLAAAGLVAFAVRGRHSVRGTVRRSPPHRYALARR